MIAWLTNPSRAKEIGIEPHVNVKMVGTEDWVKLHLIEWKLDEDGKLTTQYVARETAICGCKRDG